MPDAKPHHSPEHEPKLSEERAWIAQIRGGDAAAFKSLYESYADRMFAVAFASLESRTEAEDVVHDVFLGILRQGSAWEVTGELRNYLLRAVHNQVNTRRRHLRVELTSHETLVREAGSPTEWVYRGRADDALGERELAEALARAVAALPIRAQQAYRLVREQQLSYAATAEIMGISLHTVELHVIRALKSLREELTAWRQR